MDFEFTEEQRLLTQTVERFAADRYGNGQRARYVETEAGFSQENWRLLAETGVLALPFSEESGGFGGTAVDVMCVMTALGKQLAVEPLLGGPILAGSLLDRAGADAQKRRWAPLIMDGAAHLALAHAEKEARYHLDHVRAQFSLSAGRARLTGTKTFVLAAGAADGFLVSAVPADAQAGATDRASAIRLFLVAADAPGLERRDYRLMDGSIACALTLRNAEGAPMSGSFADLVGAVSLTKIAACAEMLGVMERLFEDTLEHLKTRRQFDQPLSAFQVIQHRMADLYASLELARSQLYRAAASDPGDADHARAVSGAKAYISEAAITLAEECVQLHGAMGVTNELIIGHGLKRVRVLAAMFGDAAAELDRCA
ncbi:MAG: acyl-CoA dehydrogenase [Caulobacterales bacterium]|nr:acyl-CoA dehydrogenase [Caulobacterales bacterium]